MTNRRYIWAIADDTEARATWAAEVQNIALQDDPCEEDDNYCVGTNYLTTEQDQALINSGYFTVEDV